MNALAAASVSVALLAGATASLRARDPLRLGLALGPYGAWALAPLVALSTFLIAAGLLGRLFASFDAGLIAGAVALVLLAIASRRLLPPDLGDSAGGAPRPDASSSLGGHGRAREPGAPSLGSRAALALSLLAVGIGYALLSTKYQMHDEHALFGHKSMVEELRRGFYPPYAPSVPEIEVRYHYGFDVLSGALARAYGLSADAAIDVVTVGLALSMSLASAAVVADVGALAAAPFAALVIHLGAGLAALMLAGVAGRHPRCLIQYHHPSCGVELFPTQLLNVFQHPVSLGVPLLLGFLLLAPRLLQTEDARRARVSWLLSLVLLPALALGQIAYFALAALAILAVAPLVLARRDPGFGRALARVVALIVTALGLAWLLGGMLAPNPLVDSGLVALRRVPGFPPNEGIIGILRHHAANLGLPFLLLPYLAWSSLRARPGDLGGGPSDGTLAGTAAPSSRASLLVLLAFATGGILAAHLFVYVRSWDIVKFPSAASFALAILYAARVDAPLAGRPFPWTWVRRLGRALVIGTGALALAYLAFPLREDVRPYELGTFEVDPLVKKVIAWFDTHDHRREELVYAQSNVAKELAIGGGLSVVGQDADLYYLGIKDSRLREVERRTREIQATMSMEALAQLRVGWLVFSDEEIDNLAPSARVALEDSSRFEVVADLPGENARRRRRIFRVVRPTRTGP